MEVLGGIGTLAVIVVSIWVGGRLLVRRSGWLSPEVLLGASMFIGGVFALPLSIAAASERVPGDLRVMLGIAGQVATFVMCILQAGFVLAVFQRHATWARLGFIALVSAFTSLWIAQISGPGLSAFVLSQEGPLGFNILLMEIIYFWATLEPLRHYAKLQKRLNIGLGDPLAAKRMLLWGFANLFSLISNACIITTAFVFGTNPLQSPALIGWIGILALASASSLYLAFLPGGTSVPKSETASATEQG